MIFGSIGAFDTLGDALIDMGAPKDIINELRQGAVANRPRQLDLPLGPQAAAPAVPKATPAGPKPWPLPDPSIKRFPVPASQRFPVPQAGSLPGKTTLLNAPVARSPQVVANSPQVAATQTRKGVGPFRAVANWFGNKYDQAKNLTGKPGKAVGWVGGKAAGIGRFGAKAFYKGVVPVTKGAWATGKFMGGSGGFGILGKLPGKASALRFLPAGAALVGTAALIGGSSALDSMSGYSFDSPKVMYDGMRGPLGHMMAPKADPTMSFSGFRRSHLDYNSTGSLMFGLHNRR
jgi:hypothetical protein